MGRCPLASWPCLRKATGFFFFLIEVELIYNVALISAIQQSDSVTHIYILFHILFHYGLSQDMEYSSLKPQDFDGEPTSLLRCIWGELAVPDNSVVRTCSLQGPDGLRNKVHSSNKQKNHFQKPTAFLASITCPH